MLPYKVIAVRMEQYRESPWIPECDQMRLSRVEFDVEHSEQRDLFSCDLRLVYPVSHRRVQYCPPQSAYTPPVPKTSNHSRDVHIKNAFLYFLFSKSAMTLSTICDCGVRRYIASTSRLGGRRCSICSMSGISQALALLPDLGRGESESGRTCDVLVQDGVFFDYIVEQSSRVGIYY